MSDTEDRSEIIDLAYRRAQRDRAAKRAAAYQRCVKAERLEIRILSVRIPHKGKIR